MHGPIAMHASEVTVKLSKVAQSDENKSRSWRLRDAKHGATSQPCSKSVGETREHIMTQ